MIESLSNEINESGEQESAASKHRGKQQLSAVVDGDDGAEQGMDASAERIGWRVHLDLKCLMWNNRQALGAATRSPKQMQLCAPHTLASEEKIMRQRC